MWGCDAGVKSVAGAKRKEDKADPKHTSLLEEHTVPDFETSELQIRIHIYNPSQMARSSKMANIRLKGTSELFDPKEEQHVVCAR